MKKILKTSNSNSNLATNKVRNTPTYRDNFSNGHKVDAPKPHYHIKTYEGRNVSDQSYMGFDPRHDKMPASAYSSVRTNKSNSSLDKIG